jgi:hypothetical protein
VSEQTDGRLAFCMAFRFSAAEMGAWAPERIASFFDGVAKILHAAKGGMELSVWGYDPAQELEKLRAINESLAARVAAQSELLSRAAEKLGVAPPLTAASPPQSD